MNQTVPTYVIFDGKEDQWIYAGDSLEEELDKLEEGKYDVFVYFEQVTIKHEKVITRKVVE